MQSIQKSLELKIFSPIIRLYDNETIVVFKEYNKHYSEMKYFHNYSKYSGSLRTDEFEALKHELILQQLLSTKVNTEQKAATSASFGVALEIAKHGKLFNDGKLVKECLIAVAEEMWPQK